VGKDQEMIWYLEEMQAFHDPARLEDMYKAGYKYDIDLWMSDLVAEFHFMEFLKTECRFARAKAKVRGQTLNREIRSYNDLVRIPIQKIS